MKPFAWLLLAAAVGCAPARADCLRWGTSISGAKVCTEDDAVNRDPVVPLDDKIWFSHGTTVPVPPAVFGCAEGEERVMRQDFSVACATGVRPQRWHNPP
jgi:hypothetical protein